MNSTSDQPLSRRAAREARLATGEQPSVVAASAAVEDTASTGGQVVLGADGQPLTRRRLRELRETGLIPVVTPASSPVVPAAPEPPQSAFAPPSADTPVPAWTAPEGHWTRQLELEDDLEVTASREVGAASTSSVLVVDDIPKAVDLGGPLGETGQVLLTGSVTLSPDFAATGAIKGLDADTDLPDGFDGPHPLTGGSAAPVRASAIASQHALGTPIVAGGKPRASRAVNILIVTAAVLAVLVTGLVVTAVVMRWI